MNNDQSNLPISAPNLSGDADLLVYDFFKHLTSLAILILGGVLIVAQAAVSADIKRGLLVAILVLISAGGILAFSGSIEIVRSRSTGTPARRSLRWSRMLAPALMAVGVGMFLSMFIDSLD